MCCVWKPPLPPSLRAASQQEDKNKVIESIEDDVCAAVDICGSNATAYKCLDVWVRFDQIEDEQHRLPDVAPAHVADLEASFLHHDLGYSRGFTPATAVEPAVKPFDPFDLLDCNKRQANGAA